MFCKLLIYKATNAGTGVAIQEDGRVQRPTVSWEGGSMKAIIGTAVGVLGLGGLLLASSGRTTTSDNSAKNPVVAGERVGSTVVDCGEGRQALVHPTASGASRVECVPMAVAQPQAIGVPYATSFAPAAPVVQERVVYRDRPATRTASRAATRSTPATYSAPAPVYSEPQRQTRSWKKSAVIIGGATAGGAGVGAVLGGKSGAKKGAVVGLVGGTVYDIATRNK
jgi:hypothetical protein